MKEKLDQIIISIKEFSPNSKLNEAFLGNILSFIHETLSKDSWVGIYRLVDNELILSTFQGTPACEVIKIGKGVVGSSFEKEEIIYAEDVTKIENYICCDEKAKSEICIPLFKNNKVVAILDIDLPFTHDFKDEIEQYKTIAEIVEQFI